MVCRTPRRKLCLRHIKVKVVVLWKLGLRHLHVSGVLSLRRKPGASSHAALWIAVEPLMKIHSIVVCSLSPIVGLFYTKILGDVLLNSSALSLGNYPLRRLWNAVVSLSLPGGDGKAQGEQRGVCKLPLKLDI